MVAFSRRSHGKTFTIAAEVAGDLGSEYISRELLREASNRLGIPQEKWEHALHRGHSVFDLLTGRRDRYLAYVQCALLEGAQRDDVVYVVPAAHFMLDGIAHVLKVGILSGRRDKAHGVLAPRHFGHENSELRPYHLLIDLRKGSEKELVERICRMVALPRFQATPESQASMNDLVLASRIRAELLAVLPCIVVKAYRGMVEVDAEVPLIQEGVMAEKCRAVAAKYPEVKDIRLRILTESIHGLG
ncbi:cytidylate kinase family protein [Thermodesulfobacteriota bacterium]